MSLIPAKEEVQSKKGVSGRNEMPPKKNEPGEIRQKAERVFGGQGSDIARLLLLGAGGLSAVFDDPGTAVSVMLLVTAEAAIGLMRERSCIKVSEKLGRASEPVVLLHTEDKIREAHAGEIHEGDIFEIGVGGVFPCDCLIIEQHELTCDESLLTGSDAPVEKSAYSGEEQRDKLGLRYIGYSGTVVLSGGAVCKAAGHGSEAFQHKTEQMERTSLLVTESRIRAERIFTAVCAAACALIAVSMMMSGRGITSSLSLAMAAAAVCIPERLDAAAEISSARLRKLLFRKGIIVKGTSALERLGETELVLADLRGVITDSTRSVRKVYIPADSDAEYDYSEITGRLTFGKNEDGYMAWENSALSETMICAAVCSRARRVRESMTSSRNRHSYYEGDSDDAALLALCSACGIDRELLLMNKISERDDTPAEGCVSVTCRLLGGEVRIYSKGHPEDIFSVCEGVYGSEEPEAIGRAMKKVSHIAESGQGVIAFCVTAGNRTLFLGAAGLWSPVPCKTSEAIRCMRKMGVRTLMFTQDERQTARAAATEAGILTEGKRCCTGSEMDSMTDEQIEAVSGAVTVFARTEPRHKARIAALSESLKTGTLTSVSDRGEAAQLKKTQTLILSCDTSHESVKQQADVIVPQCCLEEISGAIKCGRTLFDALKRRAGLGIEMTSAVLLMLLFSVIVGMAPPFLPVQLLFSALITEPCAAVALSMIPAGRSYSFRRFSNEDRFIGRKMFSVHCLRGTLTAFSVLGCFTVLLRNGSMSTARTGVTVTFALSRLISVISLCCSGKISVKTAAAVIFTAGVLAAAVSFPFFRIPFGFEELSIPSVFISLLFAVLPSALLFLIGKAVRKAV